VQDVLKDILERIWVDALVEGELDEVVPDDDGICTDELCQYEASNER